MPAQCIEKLDTKMTFLGGISGIAGSLILICVIFIVVLFIGEDPSSLAGWVERFASIKHVRAIENSFYMLTLTLWIPFYVSLYRTLYRCDPVFSLFGCIICTIGLSVMIVGALPHIAVTPLYEIYYFDSTSNTEKASIALIWQAIWGIFDAILYAGFWLVSVGLVLFGTAMMSSQIFKKWLAHATTGFGLVCILSVFFLLLDPNSSAAFLIVCSLILINGLLGFNMIRLSVR
ncbi:DUF4386 family protein [Alteromonas oceanisediminis]|uniref:DUF4386 family protein n=1 Tax=Alteromonas oceanisediminis TaxID=2836180 RepID=UPI001BDA1A19|nr:DUF4386 family protein [Alteromonas oceanisediminis]MBT0586140.1 DUF4386 family protein [Alteromonas oceanisediminis]